MKTREQMAEEYADFRLDEDMVKRDFLAGFDAGFARAAELLRGYCIRTTEVDIDTRTETRIELDGNAIADWLEERAER